jgi:DNA-directed RNA polymerase specialized sigma24 family protein
MDDDALFEELEEKLLDACTEMLGKGLLAEDVVAALNEVAIRYKPQ